MSEFHIISTSAPVPPVVPTSFVTDNGTAIPALNILDIFGQQSSTNNVSGIYTQGSGNEVDVILSNRFSNTVTTSDGLGQTQNLVLALLNTAGTFMIQGYIVAFNSTDSLGATFQYNISLRSDGANLFLIGPNVPISKEEGTMVGVVISITIVASSAIVSVTGLAGKTIKWFGLLTYQFIGV